KCLIRAFSDKHIERVFSFDIYIFNFSPIFLFRYMHKLRVASYVVCLAVRFCITIKLTGGQKRSFWTSSERSERKLSALLASSNRCIANWAMAETSIYSSC